MTCERCRELMLPFLYDALELVERQEIANHLESCPACQEAMKAAREQQSQLSDAVKDQFTDVVFKAPANDPASKPTLAMPRPAAPTGKTRRSRGMIFLLNRWAIAATLLGVLLSGAGVIGWMIWNDRAAAYADAQSRLAKAREELNKAKDELNRDKSKTQQEIRAIHEQIDALFDTWKNDENKTRKVLQDKGAQLRVIRPQNLVAGAKNTIEVEPLNTNNDVQQQQNFKGQQNQALNQQQVMARVIDQRNQKPLSNWQQLKVGANNRQNYELPPDLPIKPGDDIALVFQTQNAEGKLVELRENLKLLFPEYVTHLATDRPLYRPGETVRYRSLTLERFSLKPSQEAFHLRYRILGPRGEEVPNSAKEVASQLVDAKNQPIKGPNGQPLLGLGVGEYPLPADIASGQYTLVVNEVNERFHEEKRTFLVNRWQTPRFNKEVTFHRSSYGAGDQVRVTVRVTPIEGRAANVRGGIRVEAQARVDNDVVHNQWHNTDENGRIDFEFAIPNQVFKGVGTLTIKCEDGGSQETMVRPIPIAVRDLQVDLYPEGGELIVGVPNRVYVQARTLTNRAADIQGRIVDDRGLDVARVETLTDPDEPGINQGLGSFTFTPDAKRRYTLRIESPIGIDRTVQLPATKERGVVLHVPKGVVEKEINVTLHNVKDRRELLVGAYCRGRMLDHKFVKAEPNQTVNVTLKPVATVGGVYRITVFEKSRLDDDIGYRPLAERLIYRKTAEHADVAVIADRGSYQPGERVKLNLEARNEKRQLVPGVALVAVVDNSVLKLADEKTARTLPTHFLLTTEVRNPENLEYADVLLGNHPKAAASLDLLLGCQGWRRFAEQDPVMFQRKQQQAKAPIFLANGNTIAQFVDSEQKQIEKLDQNYVAKAIDLQKKLAAKERVDEGPIEARQAVDVMDQQIKVVENDVSMAESNLDQARLLFVQFSLGGILLIAIFVGFYLISIGLRRLSDGESPRVWFGIGFGLFALLFLTSIIGTYSLMGHRIFNEDPRFMGRGGMKMIAPAAVAGMEGGRDQVLLEPAPFVPDDDRRAPDAEDQANGNNEKQQANLRGQRIGVDFNNLALNNGIFNGNNNFDIQQRIQDKLNNPNVGPDEEERFLRQQGQYQAILLRNLGRRVQLPPANDPSVVRVYAHRHQPAKDEVRRDFAETLYWHPVLVMPDGKAQVQFDLSEAITQFEVHVLSHTFDGRLGANRTLITSKLPFSVEPKVPIEVSNNDQIVIPVALNNDQPKATSVSLSTRVKGLLIEDNPERGVMLEPNQAKRELFRVKPSILEGVGAFRVIGRTARAGDAVERKFKIVPDGFPVTGSISGVIENNIERDIELPETWIPGTLKVEAHFYPSPLAELQSGLESMLREPHGCFEQSSSSNYPNVLILNHLRQTNQGNPGAEKRARQLLQSGYQKLTSFECPDTTAANGKRGIEWFGQAPAHEALTAYGLLQFRDMAKVYPVDADLLARTEQYLLEQRDGKGGFKRNPRGLDQFGRAPDPVTNAYIVWALTESGVKANLDTELDALKTQARNAKDPYLVALASMSHLNRKKVADGVELLQWLRGHQKPTGEVAGAEVSITGSRGNDLLVETTALSVLGWLKADRPDQFHPNIHNAVKWLSRQRRGKGDFGSTQATILALKAMTAYTQKNPKVLQGGEIQMIVRGAQPAQQRANPVDQRFGVKNGGALPPEDFELPRVNRAHLSPRAQDPITINLADVSAMRPGRNTIQLIVGNNSIPYTLTWSYRTLKPTTDPNAPVKLSTKLDKAQATEGETVKLTAVIENASKKGQGMTVAIVGLPGGLSLPENFDQLKALAQLRDNGTKAGVISAWEVRGRDLVLYWRDLAPDAKVTIEVDLVCRLPGLYRGPASRAYLYYDADRKHWNEPLSIRIAEAQ